MKLNDRVRLRPYYDSTDAYVKKEGTIVQMADQWVVVKVDVPSSHIPPYSIRCVWEVELIEEHQ